MPRKKAEPEVLQEETVQPEITDIEELTPAERPGLAPQIEEPVQPYGEEEVAKEEAPAEAAEPEKTTEKKTMSIAERARLASSLEESESEDKTEKPDESETADIASEEKTEE